MYKTHLQEKKSGHKDMKVTPRKKRTTTYVLTGCKPTLQPKNTVRHRLPRLIVFSTPHETKRGQKVVCFSLQLENELQDELMILRGSTMEIHDYISMFKTCQYNFFYKHLLKNHQKLDQRAS